MACIFLSKSVGECREIVFVINTGQSMAKSDPSHVVEESLLWSAKIFNADDELGIIAFKDAPIVVRPLSKIKDAPADFHFEYSGESNAGAALLSALDLLTSKFHSEKSIVVISNGEIFLGNSAANLDSLKNFQAGLQQAKWWNIPVYIINLRYYGEPQNYHSFAADAKEIPCAHSELMTTLRTVVHDDFHAAQFVLTPKPTNGQFTCKIPFVAAKRLEFLLLSSNVGTVEPKNFYVEKTTRKNFIKIFEVNSPTTDEFSFDMNFPEGTGLTLDVLAEIEGELQTNLMPQLFAENVLEITPVHGDEKIFGNKFFDDKNIRVQLDGEIFTGQIFDGTIKVGVGENEELSLQKVFFEDAGITFLGNDTAQIKIAGQNFFMWALTAAAILVILILSGLLYRKNHLPATGNFSTGKTSAIDPRKIPSLVKIKPSLIRNKNFSYKGELLVYVTKNSDEDFPSPKTFNLFRLNSSAPIDLAKVLKTLHVETDFQGAQKIIFSPSANGVYVENLSDCTLVKMNEPIANGEFVELQHEESIDIATADRLTELIVTYRSLKPN
ncbi:MAG: VWA domain-containing protein [Selenomonadaceae bacterium]|nr:VWA domain-containing protein [Selenomonadaceae bacterium]